MTRVEFMSQLERLLQTIPQAEREEALQYYNDYFDDAGTENEQSVVEALGNPAKVAETIKRDMAAENGYGRPVASDRAVVEYKEPGSQSYSYNEGTAGTPKKEPLPTWAVVLIVILLIIAAPILLGLASGLFGTVFGLLVGWFALIFAFGVASIALFVAAVALILAGFASMTLSPIAGIAILGVAMLLAGIGILFMMLTVAMVGIATPAIFKGCVWAVKKLAELIKGKA